MAEQALRHFGSVVWADGSYARQGGSAGWSVQPILGFEGSKTVFPAGGLRLPLGQVEVLFEEPIEDPYCVCVTAWHSDRMPLIAANYGSPTRDGFVVHLWGTAADRTLVNGNFSFVVIG